jgi:hypothetical protein
VDQAGEQIIFSLEDKRITAHIQISFTGMAKDFAWVVPVMTKPTLSVGRAEIFTAVANGTRPTWQLDWDFGGQCGGNTRDFAGLAGGAPTASAPPGAPEVNVLEMREVGPYESVVLESKNATALVEWLNKNGYVQPPSAVPLIKHYVDAGFLFLGLKLQQDAMVGEIQPIVLEMDNPEACVPLVLTRVAAVADMPIQVYGLGKARVFPKNWFHVEVNQKRIDWLNGGSNYRAVVTEAINDAAGRGFVTEYAGPTTFLKSAVYQPSRWDLTRLAAITDPAQFVQTMLSMGFPRDASMQSMLRKHIPMPQSLRDRKITEQMFYNNLAAYRADLNAAGFRFDAAAFIADLNERVIEPLKKAQAMFDAQPYMTRLFATVSPDEMTRDPLFLMNAELPKVSNIHRARASGECRTDGTMVNIDIKTENGDLIRIPGPWGRFGTPTPWTFAAAEPAARTIELVGLQGKPVIYTRVQAREADQALTRGEPPADVMRRLTGSATTNPVTPHDDGTSWWGCSVAGPASGGALGGTSAVLILAAAAALLRRRRR